MALAFRRQKSGLIVGELEPAECAVILGLVNEIRELTGPRETAEDKPSETDEPSSGNAWAVEMGLGDLVHTGEEDDLLEPDDPVAARLFPDAYEDPMAASDFRRFTRRSLREGKYANAEAVFSTIVHGLAQNKRESALEITLDDEAAQQWMGALNDIRIALGTRLGVDDEGEPTVELEQDGLDYADVYDFLTWLQSSLIDAVTGG